MLFFIFFFFSPPPLEKEVVFAATEFFFSDDEIKFDDDGDDDDDPIFFFSLLKLLEEFDNGYNFACMDGDTAFTTFSSSGDDMIEYILCCVCESMRKYLMHERDKKFPQTVE